MSVADVDVERLLRCAYRLQQVSDDVDAAAIRTSRCFPDDWRGDAGIAYQMRLNDTAGRVRRMSAAYEAAAAALLPYAQAVLEAQDLWRRSDALLAEAAAADQASAAAAATQGVARLAGPSPGEGFRSAAYRLQADAADVVHRASVVCAATLDDEADRAPAVSGWRSADRFLGDIAQTGVGMVAGTASLLGSAVHALPGVGGAHSRHQARHELVEDAKAAVSIWSIPLEIRDALVDDRPGLVVGAMAGAIGPGKLSKLERHRLRDVGLAEKEAYREADRRASLAGRGVAGRPAERLGNFGVDLADEELRGGHTLERHVAASRGYLRLRNARGTSRAGTFRDAATAQRLVNEVLHANAEYLPQVYRLRPDESLPLNSTFDFSTGWISLKGVSRMVRAHSVTVVLKLDEAGEPYVYTAYPEL